MRVPETIDWNAPELARAETAARLFRNIKAHEIAGRVGGQLCYLATPYSKIAVDQRGDWCADLSKRAGLLAADVAAYLALEGITAISPITLSDAMVRAAGIEYIDPLDQKFWTTWCAPLLRACKVVIVPELDGWQQSRGVWFEVRSALVRNRRVFLLQAPDFNAPRDKLSAPLSGAVPLAATP